MLFIQQFCLYDLDNILFENVSNKFQELPEQWNNTKKISITVKQQVAPLQANEVANIRRKTASFDVSQHKFRESFRAIPPFKFDCDKPYAHLDKVSWNAYGTSIIYLCLELQ